MLHYWIILDIIIKQCNNSDLKIGVSLVNHRLNNDLDASVKKKKKKRRYSNFRIVVHSVVDRNTGWRVCS